MRWIALALIAALAACSQSTSDAGNTHQSNHFDTTGDAGTGTRTGAGPDLDRRSPQRRF